MAAVTGSERKWQVPAARRGCWAIPSTSTGRFPIRVVITDRIAAGHARGACLHDSRKSGARTLVSGRVLHAFSFAGSTHPGRRLPHQLQDRDIAALSGTSPWNGRAVNEN